jgi:hypothetical protein
MISRTHLQKLLVRAAIVRSLFTLILGVPLVLALASLLPKNLQAPWIMAAVFFGGIGAIAWLMTQFYCKRKVPCPVCGRSLWECGTGNFKPRHMRVRKSVEGCPHCRTAISRSQLFG